MNRLQWFKISPLDRKSLKTLGEKLLRMPYSKSNRVGFRMDHIKPDVINGRFIERVEFTEVLMDPFGIEVKIDRVRFDTTDFSVYSDVQLIECLNPGRNLKNFLNEVAKTANFEVTISKVEIPLQEFAKTLGTGAKSMAITKAVADDIEMAAGVLGQLQAAGAVDIRKPLQQFLGDRKYALNRIRVVLEAEDEKLTLEASRAGTVSSASQMDAKLRQVLRKKVAELATTAE